MQPSTSSVAPVIVGGPSSKEHSPPKGPTSCGSGVRPGVAHFLGDLVLELREVLAEEVGEFLRLLVVGILVVPGLARVKDAARDARDFERYVEAEEGVLSRLGAVQLVL